MMAPQHCNLQAAMCACVGLVWTCVGRVSLHVCSDLALCWFHASKKQIYKCMDNEVWLMPAPTDLGVQIFQLDEKDIQMCLARKPVRVIMFRYTFCYWCLALQQTTTVTAARNMRTFRDRALDAGSYSAMTQATLQLATPAAVSDRW